MAEYFGTDVAPEMMSDEERRQRMFGAAAPGTVGPSRPAAELQPRTPAPTTAAAPSVPDVSQVAPQRLGAPPAEPARPGSTDYFKNTGLRPGSREAERAITGPGQPTAEALEAAGPPRLGGLKKGLEIAARVAAPIFGMGGLERQVESAIPGSPANYDMRLGQARQEDTRQLGLQKTKADIADTVSQTGLRDAQAKAAANPKPEKPENIDQMIADASQEALSQGRDPNSDPKVLQLNDVKQRGQKEPAPQKVSPTEDIQKQIAEASARGDQKAVRELQDRARAMQPLAEDRLKDAENRAASANNNRQDALSRKDIATHDRDYVKPAEAIERSYQMYQDAMKAYNSGDTKTGAATMLALSQHLGTTFGQVKGSRMNKDLIQEHKNAIGISDKIDRFVASLTRGDQLSASQMKEFGDQLKSMRDLTWQITKKEGDRKKVPTDYLPTDLAGSSGSPTTNPNDPLEIL